MTTLLVLAAGALCACGTYLISARQLSRVVIGIGLLGHGVNLLLVLSGGDGGAAAFAGGDATGAEFDAMSDPLPQAFVLTAIVITFGVVAFLLAMAFRSWYLTGDDAVEDGRPGDEANPVLDVDGDRVPTEDAVTASEGGTTS